MLKKTLLVVTLLAATATFAGAEQIDNPEYQNWKQFKPGAMVKLEQVSKMAGNETKIVNTITLKELTDEKAVVSAQMTMYIMGNEMKQPAQNRDVPAKIEKVEPPAGTEKPEMEEGEETINVGGKDVACKWMKTTMKMGGNTTVSKVWTSTAVPGGTVKMESRTEGSMTMESTMVVTEFKTE